MNATTAVVACPSKNFPSVPHGKRLIDKHVVAAKYDADPRSIVRWADAGVIPHGIKLGWLRKWDSDEIDAHIAAGCPRVRVIKKAKRTR
jgi:hypothetical protein